MNKPQHWIFLLTVALILALLPGTALAEPEGKIPDYNLTLRDPPSATGDSLIIWNVTIPDCENGRLEADKEKAVEGETVTLTVTPDDGYILDVLTVLHENNPVTVTDYTFSMPAGDVTVTATFRENLWRVLQKAINECGGGGEKKIQLVKPGDEVTNWEYTPIYTDANGCITSGPEDSSLRIDRGKNITLDLNGCTIDRNVSRRTENGSIFYIDSASLTLQDTAGGGKVTGGWNDRFRESISVIYGSFTLEGGTISAEDTGISLNHSTFTMTDGVISGTGIGKGVYLSGDNSSATLSGGEITGFNTGVNRASGVSVAGNPVIAANGNFWGLDNLYLRVGETIAVTGSLEEGAYLGLTMEEPGVFAHGENYTLTPADAVCFFSDDPAYTVQLNAENNELVLYEPSTGYPPNHGNGNQTEAADDDGDNVLKPPAGLSGEPLSGSALADTGGETGFSFVEILRLLLLQMLGLARG